MRFSADRKALLKACDVASTPVRRSGIPVLECLKIIAGDGGSVRAIGTNMEVEAQAQCKASIPEHGECVARADLLRGFLQVSDGDVVEARSDGGVLSLSCGGASLDILLSSHDLPRLKAMTKGDGIDGGIEAIKLLSPFCTESGAEWQRGIFIDGDMAGAGSGVVMMAAPVTSRAKATIPLFAATAAQKIGGRLFASETAWRIEADGAVIGGRCIEMSPPSFWRQLINPGRLVFECEAEALTASVAAVSIGQAGDIFISSKGSECHVVGEKFISLGAKSSKSILPVKAVSDFAFVMKAKQARDIASRLEGEIRVTADGRVIQFSDDRGVVGVVAQIADNRTELPEATLEAAQ